MNWCQLQFCRWNWLMLPDSTPSWVVQGSCWASSRLPKICRFGIPKCMNSLRLVRSVCFSLQSSTFDQVFACFCHAWHRVSGQLYSYIPYIYMENWMPPHNSFLEMFEFWCRRLQTFKDLNTEAWDSCSRFSVWYNAASRYIVLLGHIFNSDSSVECFGLYLTSHLEISFSLPSVLQQQSGNRGFTHQGEQPSDFQMERKTGARIPYIESPPRVEAGDRDEFCWLMFLLQKHFSCISTQHMQCRVVGSPLGHLLFLSMALSTMLCARRSSDASCCG